MEPETGFEDVEDELEGTPEVKEAAKTEEKKPAADDEVAKLRAENARLNGRLSEEEENTRFWHDKAKTGGAPEKPAKNEDDDKLSDDVVEALSSGDKKRITALFGSMGFVRRDEVESKIESTKNQVVSETELMNQFPELRDKTSAFFKATATHYNNLKADPDFARSKNITLVAAQLASAELKGKNPKTGQAETDEDRNERVQRQTGNGGRRPSNRQSAQGDDQSNELNDAQRQVIARFQAAGASLTEEGYKKRAQSGVRMGGAPTRRK